jgi:hypothetical protein
MVVFYLLVISINKSNCSPEKRRPACRLSFGRQGRQERKVLKFLIYLQLFSNFEFTGFTSILVATSFRAKAHVFFFLAYSPDLQVGVKSFRLRLINIPMGEVE